MLKPRALLLEENPKETRNKQVEEEQDDATHVNELSDLFSTIENEFGNDSSSSAIDFSVLLEGEHAFNVEEVSELFTDLEETPVQDVDDAAVVDDVAALFTSLEQGDEPVVDTDSETESADETVVVADSADAHDAANIDELSDLFTALEDKEEQEASRDWIASLDVDDVSGLFTELEQLQTLKTEEPKPKTMDPRIFVPTFSVRMDGGRRAPVPLHRVPTAGAFLAGPPGLLAGPPSLLPAVEKRKAADPSISETRRACASKRRRVNGRFVREQNTFVAITALQPSP